MKWSGKIETDAIHIFAHAAIQIDNGTLDCAFSNVKFQILASQSLNGDSSFILHTSDRACSLLDGTESAPIELF